MKAMFTVASSPLFASLFAASALLVGATFSHADSMLSAQGKVLFAHNCHACHSEDSARNTFGPSLSGVVGRKAASVPRFAYSDAMKASGLVWNEDNLRMWIADNVKLVPGTRMRHVAISDKAEQDYILAYLNTL